MYSLEGLLKYTAERERDNLSGLVDIIIKYSNDKKIINLAQELMGSVEIDLLKLESLVNPDKFNFPDYEIGLVGVKEDNNEII